MSKIVIAEEAAEEEVQGWCDNFEVTLDIGSRERIVRAVMAGRITFDGQAETFDIQLRKPIDLDNGESVTSIKLKEPDTRNLRDANKAKDDFEMTLRLLSCVSGHPLGVMERIKQKDLILAGEMFNFFG